MACAVGMSVHYGRAELVAVSGSVAHGFVLADRRTVALLDDGLPLAPYHHEGLRLPVDEVAPMVAAVRASALRRATSALVEARDRLGASVAVVEASPFEALPAALEDVFASYALTCAADGMLYREAVVDGAVAAGLDVVRLPRGVDVAGSVAARLGWTPARVAEVVRGLGVAAGPPWRKEHKAMAAAAIGALGTA